MKIEEICNPGYGFRLLKAGETIPLTAEWISCEGWGRNRALLSHSPYGSTVKHGVYRIPIEVGEGWELASKEDVARCLQPKGLFEYLRHDKPTAWTDIAYSSHTGEQWAKDPNILAFRRRKPEPVKEVNTCAAVEEKQFYWLGIEPLGLSTESEARRKLTECIENGHTKKGIILRAFSTFEKVTTSEIKETKCS